MSGVTARWVLALLPQKQEAPANPSTGQDLSVWSLQVRTVCLSGYTQYVGLG